MSLPAVDLRHFVASMLLELLGIMRADTDGKRNPPKAVCVALEDDAPTKRTACVYTAADGSDVTVYVFVKRPASPPAKP